MTESSTSLKDTTQRSGKYRHLYGENARPEFWFEEIKSPLASGEGTFIKANGRFFAVAKEGGGGPVYVQRLDRPGRVFVNAPTISVHKGLVFDFDFHPFIDNMIATGSEDTHVCICKFPNGGLKENITEPTVRLIGHGKKVALVEFNPSANSILATGSFDRTVRVWNIETGTNVCTYDGLGDNIYSMNWNADGSLLAATAKDKKLQVFDPRQPTAAQVVESFDGAKSSKVFWVPCLNWIGATGHTKTAKRQIKLWDLKDMSKPIETNTIDQASSILQPMYDNDIGVLYLVGKGDGTINYYELVNDDKKLYMLGTFRDTEPQKGGGWVAKKGLDVWRCEVGRFLKLTSKSIIPISFIVPRKSGEEIFQADIYPDAFAGKAALSAEDWANGQNKPPILMSLDPSVRQDLNVTDDDGNVQFTKKKTYDELLADNTRLTARVKELEIKLGIYDPSKDENNEDNANNNVEDNNNNNNDTNNNNNNNDTNNNDNANNVEENVEDNNDNQNNDDQKED